MNRNRLIAAGSATALCLSLATGLQAQNASGSTRVGDTELKGSVHTDHTLNERGAISASTDQVMPVGKANKASSLIGMDVRNSQNEKLGEIRDIVLDLHSGKVAYMVVSVGGFLGIGDKYVAVPAHAFSETPDQERLVLNADKAKLQNAPSFAKTSWPELHSPTWSNDEAYWTTESTAQGVAAGTRTGTSSATSDTFSRDHSTTRATSSANLDASTRSSVDRPGTSSADRDQFRGRITAISPETRTVTVEGPSGSREFKFSEHPVLTLKDNRTPRLTDFKVGYPVVVGFHEQDGGYIADSVIRSDAPEVK